MGSADRPITRGALAAAAVCALAALRPAERAAAGDDAPAAYDVGAQGKARFRTVQEAVDAAKAGDVVRVGPGAFDGAVRVTKTLTLVGAGPLATVLTSDLALPTLKVEGGAAVTLREIGLTGPAPASPGGVRSDAVVVVLDAAVRLEHCAIYGTNASGVVVGTGGEATLERCLVGAIESDGVVVRGIGATLVDCDVRDCVHYGVAFGRGTTGLVTRCRLSGAKWHGIRYDDASPTIRGNAIFDNARSGVYASGKTAAVVEGNLFLRNAMSGVSCWAANEDAIRGNTFANGGREAVAVLGGSKSKVERNVFFGNPTAVMAGAIAGGKGFTGALDLEGNWFWKNEKDVVRPATKGPGLEEAPWAALEAAGNRRADPGFRDAAAGDFSLADASPARAAGAGVAAPPSTASPWPADLGDVWRATLKRKPAPAAEPAARAAPLAAPNRPPAGELRGLARPWIDGLHSLTDPVKRSEAARQIREALATDDPARNHEAFLAVTMTSDVAWDRAALRPLLLACLGSAKGEAQIAGFYALFAASPEPGDLDLLLHALESPSPEMTLGGSHLLSYFTQGRIEGKAADAVLRLLAGNDVRTLTEVLRGLGRTHVSPAVEQRLLEIAWDGGELRDVVLYFVLSTLMDKSPAVVAELARAAEKPGEADRAVWGLSQGVAPEAQDAATTLLMSVFELRPGLRDDALRGLAAYGKPAQADRLEAFARAAPLDTRTRRAVDDAVRAMRARR